MIIMSNKANSFPQIILQNAQFKSKDVSSFLVLKHDHLDKLQHIKCDLDPEKYSDTILQNVLRRQGDKLTQVTLNILIINFYQYLGSA